MATRSVVLIDQHGYISNDIKREIGKNVDISHFDSIANAELTLKKKPFSVGLVVLDASLMEKSDDFEALISSTPQIEWIAIVTPNLLDIPRIRSFVANAFYDYHTLPVDLDRLLMAIGHVCGVAQLRGASINAKRTGASNFGIYGKSNVMRAFFRRLEKVIDADLAVLIGGETGTGKELVAQAIHEHSKRSKGPFVAVNCGAIPQNLIQSELFGHERGAFTGALQRKVGSIEAANGGVLFLDEIGDLPLSLQANLLRVLQERTITRLGSTQVIPVDIRIISATHIDLQQAIHNGTFREDLYYRLGVIHLDVPPLRSRDGDIPLLADVFFKKFSANQRNFRANTFSSQAFRAMEAYPWPGNVRELINRVHRALILCEGKLINASDLGLEDYIESTETKTLEDARASLDRNILEISLRNNGNNVSQAARQLGVSRVTLYRMMSKHNIATAH
jgi:DNA-binding NtrC family response regulator